MPRSVATQLIARGVALAIGVLGTAAPAGAGELDYSVDVRPVLLGRCAECHGGDEPAGKIDLKQLADPRAAARRRKLWRQAIAQIEAGQMPPEGEPQLAPEERARLLDWMRRTIAAVDPTDPANRDPGPAPIRRLSLPEFNATIHDLMGFEFDAATAVGMTDDGAFAGFANLAAALDVSPALLEKQFAAADQILDRLFGVELSSGVSGRIQDDARASREAMFGLKPGEWRAVDREVAPPPNVAPREAARGIIASFARRAFRGQSTPAEIERLLGLFDRASAQGKNYVEATRLMLKAVLVSPKFLYRVELDRADRQPGEAYAVNDYELASRLSYFLWFSMPDEELLDLAERGRLTASGPSTESGGTVLEQQTRRMLADPRARSLTDNFAARWLQINKLSTARPSTEFFPEFNANVRQAMYDETATFFDALRRENGSLRDLLAADHTYLNEELAGYYGVPNVHGKQMRRVALRPEDHRGGLLGMGSILAITSHTSRTSPTLRGKWILEVLFGAPPPPPPANAGQIAEVKGKGKEIKTFREQLAQHAQSAACAACHRRMDPLGFALDHYDAAGRWRQTVGDRPLDVSGLLPSGETIDGEDDLRRIVLARRGDFIRNVSEQMLTFALGRELDYYDDGPVLEIVAALERNDDRFATLIEGVVNSYPFRYRKNRAMGE